jgi:hypothetical protein
LGLEVPEIREKEKRRKDKHLKEQKVQIFVWKFHATSNDEDDGKF